MLAKQIDLSDILSDYKKEVWDAVDEAQDEVAKEAVAELKANSPKRKGSYRRGWSKKREGKTMRVYNRTRPGLTSPLENGHVNRDGGRTAGEVHIAPVADAAAENFVKSIERRLS